MTGSPLQFVCTIALLLGGGALACWLLFIRFSTSSGESAKQYALPEPKDTKEKKEQSTKVVTFKIEEVDKTSESDSPAAELASLGNKRSRSKKKKKKKKE